MLAANRTSSSFDECIELPSAVTVFRLNNDGSYGPSTALKCSVYIDESQIHKIWEKNVSEFIRKKYGPYVGVMHFGSKDVQSPIYPTYKFVLGR